MKELSFANSISFVLFQTTLFESVFLLQTLSLGIIHLATAFWVFCCRVVASCFIWSSCCRATVAIFSRLGHWMVSLLLPESRVVSVASSCFIWWPFCFSTVAIFSCLGHWIFFLLFLCALCCSSGSCSAPTAS